MSLRAAVYFILSAVWEGSKNVGLVGEKLRKDLWNCIDESFGSEDRTQGSLWKHVSKFWSLSEKKKKKNQNKKEQGNACGAFSNYVWGVY